MSKLSKNLKTLRKQFGWKSKEVAEMLGVTPKTYSSWEVYKREPTLNTVIKLSDLFQVSLDRLVKELI